MNEKMEKYLQTSQFIDWQSPAVAKRARQLAAGLEGDEAVARACFDWVRDNIRHSWDYRMNPVTCRASDVLEYGTGYCYAKSHLLAALLRANGIPAGLCYQRLSVNDDGAPWCLHGLNAVWLEAHGWYRMDARGNKPGIDARFTPPVEHMAFDFNFPEEIDLPEIHAEPLDVVVDVLQKCETVEEVMENLPDWPGGDEGYRAG